jgi:hypothetical protein
MAVINLAQVASPSAPSASTDNIFIDTSGNLSVQKPDGNIVKIAAAGTYTLTIPATGTAALLGTAQTFSEAQTFSSALIAPGMQPASDSTTAIQLFKADGTTAVLTVDTTNSRVIGTAFRSDVVNFSSPDTAVTLSVPATGLIFLWIGSSTAADNRYLIAQYRAASSPIITKIAGSATFNVFAGDVTGTTGAAGDFTLGSSATQVTLEARHASGGRTFTYFVLS